MRLIHGLVVVVLAPVLAGCSTHPLVDDVTRSTTYDVVEKIRCEAKRAVVDHGRRFSDDTSIAYEFTFDINETNQAQGNLTWFAPVIGGSFGLVGQAGSTLSRNTVRNFTITDTFGDLRKTNCSPTVLEKNWAYPIAGDIGIYEVIGTFATLHQIDDPAAGEVFSFHDTLGFITVFSAGLHPRLDLLQVTDRSHVSLAGADLGAQRSDIHTVVIAMVGGPQAATTAARRTPDGIRRAAVMRNAAGSASGNVTNNTALSATLLQTGGSYRQAAIYELDRARILALQDRVRNQVVGP
jgi:hypothetical protein